MLVLVADDIHLCHCGGIMIEYLCLWPPAPVRLRELSPWPMVTQAGQLRPARQQESREETLVLSLYYSSVVSPIILSQSIHLLSSYIFIYFTHTITTVRSDCNWIFRKISILAKVKPDRHNCVLWGEVRGGDMRGGCEAGSEAGSLHTSQVSR